MGIVRVEGGIEGVLDRRNVDFSVFHVGVVTMEEYGGQGEEQKEKVASNRSRNQLWRRCVAHHFSSWYSISVFTSQIVGGNNWKYLMIDDPIPSGTESIARDDLYELDQRPNW